MSRFHHGEGRHVWWQAQSAPRKALFILLGLTLGAALAALFGFIVMWLWNGLMPRIFGLPLIGYWEGWGLVILSSILFKGRGPHRSFGAEGRRKRFLRERMQAEQGRGPEAADKA